MDISKIISHKELIASNVHDSWWQEKKKQGFHAPVVCDSTTAKAAWRHEKSLGHNTFPKFYKFCDKCHADMYPYIELPENIKDYDRVTVFAVLDAIEIMEREIK